MNRISLKGLSPFPDSDLNIQPGVCHVLHSTSLKCLHKSLGRMLVAAEMHVTQDIHCDDKRVAYVFVIHLVHEYSLSQYGNLWFQCTQNSAVITNG